jgi:hypothetical protein
MLGRIAEADRNLISRFSRLTTPNKRGGEYMQLGNKILLIAIVIIIALILQVALLAADRRETPATAAIEFARDYYNLKPSMSERLCSELVEEEELGVVDDYLYRMSREAESMGFEESFLKMKLFHIETTTEMLDEDSAEVHLHALRRRNLNPVFNAIARWFFLGQVYEVQETLTVLREDDHWKVCGEPFELLGL